ncbi:MAG TPA: hypothetical protein VFI38_13340 [Candidatus Acidoferrum sp.]|nr:hypothetical protein [Candidatus Acidoferrum sp.]
MIRVVADFSLMAGFEFEQFGHLFVVQPIEGYDAHCHCSLSFSEAKSYHDKFELADARSKRQRELIRLSIISEQAVSENVSANECLEALCRLKLRSHDCDIFND